jgi:DNA-binding MarR family transcriptional regulator
LATRSGEELLDLEILDAVAGLFAHLVAEGEALAKTLGVPVFVIKALHMLDTPLAMKDLGHRMHCDPSFITSIADTLEKHGLAARESDPGDRRVKRLVLTEAGADLKARAEDAILARTPWRQALSREQRASLLALLRTMSPPLSATGGPCPAEEVNTLLSSAAVTMPAPLAQAEALTAAPARAAR